MESIEERKARLLLLKNKAKGITTTTNDNENNNVVNNNDNNNKDIPVLSSSDIIKEELSKINSNELNIVPQKANWDLKNGISDKLDKLKKRTQRSIVDLLRDKITEENNDNDN